MEKRDELVSFIVPVYNMENSLGMCLDSILGQTIDNIEVVLIDDGSKDKSGEICDSYAAKDERIHVIHKENGGIADAMNAGLDHAAGDYILFVDSDDFVDASMAEIMLKDMKRTNSDIVQCGYIIHSADGRIVRNVEGKEMEVVGKDKILETYFLWRGIGGNLSAKLFKAELFSDIRMPKGRTFADVPIIPLILYKCKRYKIIEEKFYHIVSNPKSASRSGLNESKYRDLMYNVEVVSEFIKEKCPQLTYHIYYLKASTVALFYEKVKNSSELDNVKQKIKLFEKEFKENFRELRKSKKIQMYPLVRRIQLYLFWIHPYLSIFSEKIYRIFVAQ